MRCTPTAISAAALLLMLGATAPVRGAPHVSAEVEEVLAETSFARPPSPVERESLVRKLRRRGVATLTDLHPYLHRSERVRANALLAIRQMGALDAKTLARVEALALAARNSATPSLVTAVRIVLDSAPSPRALTFAAAVTPELRLAPLYEVSSWMSGRGLAAVSGSGDAAELPRLCLRRLRALLSAGSYSGRWPIRFSMVVEHPPFDHPRYTGDILDTFLAAIANAGRATDLRDIAFISSFLVVARAAERDPRAVEEGLMRIISTTARPVAQVILWRMFAEGLAGTPAGMRISEAAVTRFPELGGFAKLLRDNRAWGSGKNSGPDGEIRHALAALEPPRQPAGRAETVAD